MNEHETAVAQVGAMKGRESGECGDDGESAGRAQRKERKKSGQVRIMAMTADMKEKACDRARQARMMGFMTKPSKVANLKRLVLKHCVEWREEV